MQRTILLLLTLFSFLHAQQPVADSTEPATIEGVVRDSTSNAPVAGASVGFGYPSEPSKRLTSTTDSLGHYFFGDLKPGSAVLRIDTSIPNKRGSFTNRSVNLKAGQHLTLDIPLEINGRVSGKVVDENGDGLPGVWVFLVGKEYFAGGVRNLFKGLATTDDHGEYTLDPVEPGRSFLVYAESRPQKLDAISAVPEDPKMRRQVLVPTFYPNSRDMNGASVVTVTGGGHLEAINIKMSKAPAYCVDGVVTNAGVPGPLSFELSAAEPHSGAGPNSGMYISAPSGKAGGDGRFRICDLPSGVYSIEATQWGGGGASKAPPPMGNVTVSVGDRDVHGIRVDALPSPALKGEVVWDGPPPQDPVTGTMRIELRALERAHFQGEGISATPSIPGTFTLTAVPPDDDYALEPRTRVPDGLYIKDVTFAGTSIVRGSLRVGSAMANAGLRVNLATGAAKVTANVTNEKGDPFVAATVVAMPADVSSESGLADTMKTATTDTDGNCTIAQLAPGKYYLAAFRERIDTTPESMAKLLTARATKASEIELATGAEANASLKIVSLQ